MSAHQHLVFTQIFLRIGKPDIIITTSDWISSFAIFIIFLLSVGKPPLETISANCWWKSRRSSLKIFLPIQRGASPAGWAPLAVSMVGCPCSSSSALLLNPLEIAPTRWSKCSYSTINLQDSAVAGSHLAGDEQQPGSTALSSPQIPCHCLLCLIPTTRRCGLHNY